MRRVRGWLGNGFLALAALVVALVLAEVVLRLAHPQPLAVFRQDPYGLAMHRPGLVTYLPQFSREVSFNSEGMRDEEHLVEKPDSVFRILVLGDSFMEALQVPFDSSLPGLLGRRLEPETGGRVEIVNASVSGWGTDDQLRYLTVYGRKWKPDLVLVAMTLHNDISDNLREEWHTFRGDSLVEQVRLRKPAFEYNLLELKAFLGSRLHTYQLLRKARQGRAMREAGNQLKGHVVELFRDPTPEEISKGIHLTDLLLERLKAVTTADGGKVVLVLLPLMVQLSDQRFLEFVRSAGASLQEMPIRKPQLELTSIAGRLGIPVVDLLPVFRQWKTDGGAPLYLEHDGHWNEAGHRLATNSVAGALIAAGALEK